MVRPEKEMIGVYGPVLFTTHPAPRGFIYKYILGLTPLFLAALSGIVLTVMIGAGKSFPHSLVDPLGTIVPDLHAFIEIFVYIIAPVGIFMFFIFLGDLMNRTEIWTGAALTLFLSVIGGLVLVQGTGIPILSTSYLLNLFQWIAYLIQPFSVIATLIVIAGIELFRRSLKYTITRDVVIITGGLWNLVENVIPLHQIERIVLVQGRLGHFFHFGTIVPAGLVFGMIQIDMRGHHTTGDMIHPDTYQESTLRWEEGSHNPLVSLYGIRDPENVKERLEKAIQQISEKDKG
jgi:membrane protein YdbS with pleckstrin-like domain